MKKRGRRRSCGVGGMKGREGVEERVLAGP